MTTNPAPGTAASGTGPAHRSSDADPWIDAWLARLPAGARVLDVACGTGRHARAAARRGLDVVAVDRDEAALRAVGDGVTCVLADVENGPWPWAAAGFDAVIVSNYLFRPRLDLLCGLIRPTGALIYQTFARGNEVYGRPRNPAFLLEPGELLRLADRNGLHVLSYDDGVVGSPPSARVQRLAAGRPPVAAHLLPIAR